MIIFGGLGIVAVDEFLFLMGHSWFLLRDAIIHNYSDY